MMEPALNILVILATYSHSIKPIIIIINEDLIDKHTLVFVSQVVFSPF